MPGEYSQATLESHFENINKRLRRIEEHLVRSSAPQVLIASAPR
jgi:hypothetical protein